MEIKERGARIMNQKCKLPQIELIQVIVNLGLGSKVLKIAKKQGVTGGTIYLGRGTVQSKLLNLFAISEIRKEIVMMLTTSDVAQKTMDAIYQELHLEKPNHGIAFTTSVSMLAGTRNVGEIVDKKIVQRSEVTSMYQNIIIIVDKGKAENVMEAAKKAGAKGGTIINARGSGIHETTKLFAMDIEPEKEKVMILSEEQYTKGIVDKIYEELEIDKPGNGIIFVQDVLQTYGIYK